MKDEKYKPSNKCDQAEGNGSKHKPAHHPKIVKKLAIIVSVDNAGMR
jgi:hypothetical protein